MPLPPPSSPRAKKHTRTITVEAYAREDGLWDLDAQITDIKTFDTRLAAAIRPAGQPVHDLSLRVTIDTRMNIVDAASSSDAVPYAGYCDTISPAYRKLIGLNLMKDFRQSVKERLGGTEGCTHVTELALILPTAAVQAFAGAVFDTRDGSHDDTSSQKPFQLDRCHALRTDGAAVAKYYPRWSSRASGPESS